MLQLAARCRAAVRLAASDPIQASEARAPLAESRGVCVALWTRIGFDVSEAVLLTAPSITAAQADTRLGRCAGLLGLDRSSRGPRRLSASASASPLGSVHGPNVGPLSSVGYRGEMEHRGPSREAEPCLLAGEGCPPAGCPVVKAL